MAFAGVEETRRLYRLAVEERYRFYSFGDAMLHPLMLDHVTIRVSDLAATSRRFYSTRARARARRETS